jgi:hypothetical protein
MAPPAVSEALLNGSCLRSSEPFRAQKLYFDDFWDCGTGPPPRHAYKVVLTHPMHRDSLAHHKVNVPKPKKATSRESTVQYKPPDTLFRPYQRTGSTSTQPMKLSQALIQVGAYWQQPMSVQVTGFPVACNSLTVSSEPSSKPALLKYLLDASTPQKPVRISQTR